MLKPPTPAEARAIAEEAWLYAYAPLQGYQTLWNQTQNKAFPGDVGGFNRFRHDSRSSTPAGPFFFVARLYGPGSAALTGRWQLPALQDDH